MMKSRFILLVSLFLLLGCQKKPTDQYLEAQPSRLESLRVIFQQSAFGSKLHPLWNQLKSRPDQQGYLVPVKEQPNQNDISGESFLRFTTTDKGSYNIQLVEELPDAYYLQQKAADPSLKFSGRIFVYNDQWQLMKGKVMEKGLQVGEIKATEEREAPTATIKEDLFAAVESCVWENANYIDASGVVHVYSERICAYSLYDSGSDSGGGSPDYSTSGGLFRSGGSTNTAPPPVSNLPGEDNPKINPRQYMDCFDNLPDAQATTTITLYVQEPFAGTLFNIGPNSVGHVAIGLSKSGAGLTITQVIGFYPDASGFKKAHASSRMVDNGFMNYDKTITFSVSSVDFKDAIAYIANPPATYDMLDFNCAAFAYKVTQKAGISMPDPHVGVGTLRQSAITPVGISEAINKLKNANPANPNINTNGGHAPSSKGPCY